MDHCSFKDDDLSNIVMFHIALYNYLFLSRFSIPICICIFIYSTYIYICIIYRHAYIAILNCQRLPSFFHEHFPFLGVKMPPGPRLHPQCDGLRHGRHQPVPGNLGCRAMFVGFVFYLPTKLRKIAIFR